MRWRATGASKGWSSFGALVALAACSGLELDPPPSVIHARFDPDAKVIPMPTDVLRDAETGRLDLPANDEDLSDAEREFYAYLNTLDGWSTTMAASVEFTAPIDPATITGDTLQVWLWRGVPQRVTDARVTISDDRTKITIDAPREGWVRGGRYVVLLRGGAGGARGARGEKVECDAAFYFLRQTERLDVPAHERAFPGADRAERQDNATRLEEIRRDLEPYFTYFANVGVPREQVAALWSFTVTARTELAMDKASQRMPLPNDLLLHPDAGRVDLPPAPWDSDVEIEAKRRLAEYDGFSTMGQMMFEFTAPVDPASLAGAVSLYRVADPPLLLPADVEVMDDGIHVLVTPKQRPLAESTDYVVVVRRGARDAAGAPIAKMPVGHFLTARAPIFADGRSLVRGVADEDARRVEGVRARLAPVLDAVGRDDVLAAWPFHTLSITPPLQAALRTADHLSLRTDPANVQRRSPAQALAEFPLGIGSMANVGDVYEGTIQTAEFLDPYTRAWREDGGWEAREVAFVMTVPKTPPPGPLKVMIFGHGIMTERRFVLAIGDALAARGFAAIAIDFPLHGTRTVCYHGGPISVIHPTTGELASVNPCKSGTTCSEDGRCVDASGQGNALAMWPILNYPVASGAAFIEIDHVANTKDHFKQAIVDLGALLRSLRLGRWDQAIGRPLDPTAIYYSGQSLGGIIGATFVSLAPEVTRAVLNVPGANTVDMFRDSPYFGPFVDAFFTRQGVEEGTFQAARFMNVARWFMDATDPAGVAGRLLDGRKVMLQMALFDVIIPNAYTKVLEELSGAPRRDYAAEHGFLVIPVEPEYLRGVNELADFLTGRLDP